MAKKRASRGDFNMAAAIRAELEKNKALSLKECMAAVTASNPGQTINPSSFGVALSNQRKKLGIKTGRGRKKTVRRAKPGALRAAAAPQTVNLSALQAARKFLAEVGDVEVALTAVKQLQALQIR
jgi:hypothetical protein